jgi:hypothetical protein
MLPFARIPFRKMNSCKNQTYPSRDAICTNEQVVIDQKKSLCEGIPTPAMPKKKRSSRSSRTIILGTDSSGNGNIFHRCFPRAGQVQNPVKQTFSLPIRHSGPIILHASSTSRSNHHPPALWYSMNVAPVARFEADFAVQLFFPAINV